MLAQNFKAPADLGISDADFEALVKVLGMFERREIPTGSFAMEDFDCGTAACICGWARRIRPGVFVFGSYNKHKNDGLYQLFGGGEKEILQCTSTSQAAIALRNYLTTGEPRWSEALAE